MKKLIKFCRCFQWFKGTKMKANHNGCNDRNWKCDVVSNDSKVLKWKQITTAYELVSFEVSCFQWFKGTKIDKIFIPTLLKCTKNQHKTTSSYTHNYPSQKRTCVLNRSSKDFKCLQNLQKSTSHKHIKRQISLLLRDCPKKKRKPTDQ